MTSSDAELESGLAKLMIEYLLFIPGRLTPIDFL